MGSRYLAVALDMDGTTLSAARTLTDRTISTLRRVQAAGTRVVLATGRAAAALQPIVDALGLPGEVPAVNFNGACAMYMAAGQPSRQVLSMPLPRDDAAVVLAICERLGLGVVYTCAATTYVPERLGSAEQERLLAEYEGPDPEAEGTLSTRIADVATLLDSELPLKVVGLSSDPEADAARARELLGVEGVELHVIAAEMHVEFLRPTANKAAALRQLCGPEHLNIPLAEMAAFGVSGNACFWVLMSS